MDFKVKDGRLFTGILDKNGSEVYDGDRVMVIKGAWQKIINKTGTVQYIPNRALFAVFYDAPDIGKRDKVRAGVNYNWDDFNDIEEISLISEVQNNV